MITFASNKPKIGIFRALQLGDMLCAVPAIRSLRAAFPQAEIVLIGLPWASAFVQRFHQYIDRLIVFPGYPGLPEQPYSPEAWEQFRMAMQQEAFDCILQMQGNGSIVNPMLQQLGAAQLAGFHQPQAPVPSPLFIEYPDYGSEINRHLLLMQHLGIAAQGNYLEFPLWPQEATELENVAPFVKEEKYVCVHPGSRSEQRQWPSVNFARLADHCAAHGYKVVLTGTNNEAALTQAVQQEMKHAAIDLTGKTNLGVVANLLKGADLLIANCTGVSHIAAALQTRSLIISMDGEPERWGPLNKQLHHTIDWTTTPSFPHVFSRLTSLLN